MSLRFYFGPSGAGKSHMLYQEILARSLREPERGFFLIVPDQFTMQTQKDIVQMHPRRGIMNIDVLSFGRLSHRIFEETGEPGFPVLDDTGKNLVLRRVAQGMADRLPFLGSNLNKIGYIHEVKSVISELMQYGISPQDMEQLTEFARERGQLRGKLRDIGLLYDGFLRYIREKYVTTEETLGLLAERIASSALLRGSVVAFDGFTGFTPVQDRVIGALLTHCQEVIVTVLLGAGEQPFLQDGEQKLFYLSRKTALTLQELAREAGAARGEDVFLTGEESPRFADGGELAHLERHLFRYPVRPWQEPCARLRIREAASPRQEARCAALAIRRLVREENYCYRDIAVIAGDLGSYDDYIEEEFAKLDIPVFLDKTHGILLNPMIEYIRAALLAVRQNCSYEAVFHFLRSGCSGLSDEEIDQLENYVLAVGVRGKAAWTSPFFRRSRRMQEMDGEGAAAYLAFLNGLRERVMAQLAPLMEPQKTAGGHVRALCRFLEENRVQETCGRYEQMFARQGDLQMQREYAQIYRLVIELLDQIDELLADEPMGREAFAEILDAGFSEITVGILPQNVDRVLAGDMERTRLGQVRALFFLGVNDGNIPAAGSGGGILSDLDREFLASSPLELSPTPRQKMYIQRLYLYMNLTKASEYLTLSYARSASDGRAKKPSYLIGTLCQMFPALSIERVWQQEEDAALECPQDGMMLLADRLRQYAAGAIPGGRGLADFYGAMTGAGEEKWRGMALQVAGRAFARYEGERLSAQTAALLYGSLLSGSISRLEQFAACAYAHFLRYGMRLQERETYTFADTDMGTVFHGVLEQFSDALGEEGLDWFSFTDGQGDAMVEEALRRCASQYGETVLFDSARSAYLVTRMERILKRTVKTLRDQLKKGVFAPLDFEVSFSQTEALQEADAAPDIAIEDLLSAAPDATADAALGSGGRMRLRGRIDRIDTWQDAEKVYVRVVDYKSGSRSFDLVSVYYGLQLQLVTYLGAAQELIGRRFPEKKTVPAAVLYYRMADPMIREEDEAMTPEAVQEKIRRELCMTGLVNWENDLPARMDAGLSGRSDVIPVERKKDGTLSGRSQVADTRQFERLCGFVRRKIREFGRGIAEGEIQKNPYERGTGAAAESACTYCPYRAVCGFDTRIEGCEKRQLTAEKETAQEAIWGEPEQDKPEQGKPEQGKPEQGGTEQGGTPDGGRA